MPSEVYIHIPFCVKKCAYCDFLSFPADAGQQRRYVDALLREIRKTGEHLREDRKTGKHLRVQSIFIGGGTPSLLPAEWIAEILREVCKQFEVPADAEISIEANPGTVDDRKLRIYREAGVNRISFGCQSFHDEELRLLGRIHSSHEIRESVGLARKAGFDNINLDLMSGLPGQTLSGWENTLRQAAALQPEHISAYSLIIEEGTPFFLRFGEGRDGPALPDEENSCDPALPDEENNSGPALPDEDTERRMYERTAEILAEAGYHQYEISNYAKEGYACRHNLGYWTGVPYFGFGLGASGYLPESVYCRIRHGDLCSIQKKDIRTEGGVMESRPEKQEEWIRYRSTDDLTKYLNGTGIYSETEKLTREDLEAEFMMLGLRLTEGIEDTEFERHFGDTIDSRYGLILEKYQKMGVLIREDGRTRLTRRGISVSNVILADFL